MYRYLFRKKGYIPVFLVLLVVSSVTGSLFSLVMSALVDCAGKEAPVLLRTLLGSLAYVVVYILLEATYRCMRAKAVTDARYSLKRDVFSALMNRSVTDFDSGNSAEYMNELSNNLNQFENVYWDNSLCLMESLISFCGAAAICIALQPALLVLMILLALLSMGVTRLSASPLEKSMESFAKNAESYTTEIRDDFAGFRLIRSYGILSLILQKHDRKNRAMEDANRRNVYCRLFCAYAGNFVGLLSTVLVMAMAAYFALKGRFSAGMVIAFGHLIGNIISPIVSMPTIIANFRASRPLLERFRKLLGSMEEGRSMDNKHSMEEGHSAEEPSQMGKTSRGETKAIGKRMAMEEKHSVEEKNSPENTHGSKTIRFRDKITLHKVSFGYREDRNVLDGLSYSFQAGKHYAVVGKSGCGKSTLLSLLLGYYPDYSGSISYDGTELRELTRECLGSIVAYVSQDTFLFQDTIANNITLYDEKYTLQEVEAAVEQAGLAELVASLPEGLSTLIGENGRNFSGGEKQRLSLARALLRKSRVLLLDEFTANLDRETARKIEERIMGFDDKLIITVTHRLEPDMRPRYDGILNLELAGKGLA